MSETSLPVLVKEIGQALQLDAGNHDQEAYKKYVTCIYRIATNLILTVNQAGGDVVVDQKTSRQVKLIQQCVERVGALLNKMVSDIPGSPPASHTIAAPRQEVKQDSSPFPTVSVGTPSISSPPASLPSMQHRQQQMSTLTSPTQSVLKSGPTFVSVPSLVVDNNPYAYTMHKNQHLTPMELARRQNQSLLAAYKARMARLNRSDFSAFNYSLTLQRKMAENIAIAKAQEEELARKMQARNLRLEQEAAKRFSTPVGMSKEEQEQRQIYKRILEYENEAKWLQTWRQKLESQPDDPILINHLVQEILRCSDHPLTELLHRYQFQIYQRLYPLVASKHQELDLVQVPLPAILWPSLEDMSEAYPPTSQTKSPSHETTSDTAPNGADISKISIGENNIKAEIHKCQLEPKSARSSQASCDRPCECGKDEPCDLAQDGDTLLPASHDGCHSDKSPCNMAADWVGDPLGVLAVCQNEIQSPTINEVEAACVLQAKQDLFDGSKENVLGELPEQVGEADNVQKYQPNVTQTDIKAGTQLNKTFESSAGVDDSFADCRKNEIERSSSKSPADESRDQLSGTAQVNSKPDSLPVPGEGQEINTQLSWERRQAQLLMRQVTRDYDSYKLGGDPDYNEDNLDYLFDDDDNDYDEAAWFPNRDVSYQQNQPSAPSRSTNETTSLLDNQNVALDRSVSHNPFIATCRESEDNDNNIFQSLPAIFGQGTRREKDKAFEKLSREAYRRHLNSIAEDIHQYLEKLLVLMTIAYEPLDSPIGKDQCAVSLEEPFFKPLWKTLLRLFRVVNYQEELLLACVMTKMAAASPADFNISRKLWLSDASSKPYQRAITELMNVREHYTMLNKLDCIVRVCRLICECVDDYYKRDSTKQESVSPTAPSVGADDLLPILSYVVVQSASPQLSAECHAMSEFIHEGYMMGEEGYCLTSLRTALSFVISMFPTMATPE